MIFQGSFMFLTELNPGPTIPILALPAVGRLWPSYFKKISSYSHVLNFLIPFMLVLVHNVHPIKYSFLQISQPRGLLQKSWQTKKVWKGFARNQITKLWLKLYLFNTSWEFKKSPWEGEIRFLSLNRILDSHLSTDFCWIFPPGDVVHLKKWPR